MNAKQPILNYESPGDASGSATIAFLKGSLLGALLAWAGLPVTGIMLSVIVIAGGSEWITVAYFVFPSLGLGLCMAFRQSAQPRVVSPSYQPVDAINLRAWKL
jgi:hypothetical protein